MAISAVDGGKEAGGAQRTASRRSRESRLLSRQGLTACVGLINAKCKVCSLLVEAGPLRREDALSAIGRSASDRNKERGRTFVRTQEERDLPPKSELHW